MRILDTDFEGLKLLSYLQHEDSRGGFCKTFEHSIIQEKTGLDFDLKESYYSTSKLGVVRGMHFQYPPADHDKIVFVPQGKVFDVCVDLRKNSPTYGKTFSQELSASNDMGLLIPSGFAHGFQALEENSMTMYLLSSEYEADLDAGIRYDSCGIDWPIAVSEVSSRDEEFETLSEFDSPFEI